MKYLQKCPVEESDQEAAPLVVISPAKAMECVWNVRAYFMLYMVFDITVVLTALVQLWFLTSDSEAALSFRQSTFGSNVDIALTKATISVVAVCFALDVVLGGVLVGALDAFTEGTVMSAQSSNRWEHVQTLASINWYCNLATLIIWFAAKSFGFSQNPQITTAVGLLVVLFFRITKIRPMFRFKASVNDIVESEAFETLHSNFQTGDIDAVWWWKAAGVSCLAFAILVILMAILCLYLDQESGPTFSQGPDGVRMLDDETPRSLRDWPDKVKHDGHIWYCHDTELFDGDKPCTTKQVARHTIKNKGRDSLLAGLKGSGVGAAACAGAVFWEGVTVALAPLAAVTAAGCGAASGLVTGATKYGGAIEDDTCFGQCSDDVPQEVKEQVWCIPYEHAEMRRCEECWNCKGCVGDDGLGADASADQCY